MLLIEVLSPEKRNSSIPGVSRRNGPSIREKNRTKVQKAKNEHRIKIKKDLEQAHIDRI